MDLVHKIDLAVLLSEFIFGVYEDEAHLCSDLCSSLEDCPCVCFKLLVVFTADDALCNDLFLGDIFVMSLGSLCSRGDDRLREFLVLHHSFRHLHSADGALSCLVLSPCVA